ncbi:MAG: hypothetical protein ACLKAK_00025 [Alkaliphilus sp.]
MLQANSDRCMEFEVKSKHTDKQLRELFKYEYNIEQALSVPKEGRDKLILEIRKKTRVSIRQLSDITGIGRNIIERVTRNASRETSP